MQLKVFENVLHFISVFMFVDETFGNPRIYFYEIRIFFIYYVQ